MARIRSPNYPAISLAEAIKRIGQIHAKERQHPCSKEVVIKGMGYVGVHGVSLGALSALVKYGLLDQEGRGEDYRVSDRAVAILHPHTPNEKAAAINEAARAPALFDELLEHFKGSLPSDDNIRAYLVRKGFSQTSLANVIQSFRETMELVTQESDGYDSATNLNKEPIMEPQTHHLQPMPITTAGAVLGSPRLGTTSVKIEDDRIEVSAVLLFQENIEDLISKLQAIKGLRPRAADKRKGDQEPN